MFHPCAHRVTRSVLILGAVSAALAGCSLGAGSTGSSTSGSSTSSSTTSGSSTAGSSSSAAAAYRCPTGGSVAVATHDSFSLPEQVLAEFTKATGCQVSVLKSGDAGQLTNKLALTKSAPIADAVFGVDNTFAGRGVAAGVFAPYAAAAPTSAAAYTLAGEGASVLTPVDYGDVCVNVDTAWFAAKKVNPPVTLDDLVKPEYRGLFVTPGASTSSPGFAFLLATIGKYGKDGWADYWRKLIGNDAKVVSGWEDAYTVDFTANGGTRPIVLSYASSPPFTIPKGGTTPTTAALLDTCFRQVEYAGVLTGAKNPDGAKAFVDFLVSKPVQQEIPGSMYMFPVDSAAQLPADWAAWAKVSPNPIPLSASEIENGRDGWLAQWTDVTSR